MSVKVHVLANVGKEGCKHMHFRISSWSHSSSVQLGFKLKLNEYRWMATSEPLHSPHVSTSHTNGFPDGLYLPSGVCVCSPCSSKALSLLIDLRYRTLFKPQAASLYLVGAYLKVCIPKPALQGMRHGNARGTGADDDGPVRGHVVVCVV
jgi:hypothetical protein